MNIAFYVSGKASRFKIIMEENFELLKNVKVVFSDDIETLYLEPLLFKKEILYKIFDYKKIDENLNKNLEISNALLDALNSQKIDYCFCFGRHLLKGEILREYENRIINFHPSILPFFPGINAIDRALDAKSKVLGNTAHFIDQGMDTGPIIMQNVLSVKVFEEQGYSGVLDYQLVMIKEIFEWLKLDKISVENGEVFIKESNYSTVAFFPFN